MSRRAVGGTGSNAPKSSDGGIGTVGVITRFENEIRLVGIMPTYLRTAAMRGIQLRATYVWKYFVIKAVDREAGNILELQRDLLGELTSAVICVGNECVVGPVHGGVRITSSSTV